VFISAVIVTGTPGIGKSQLLRWIARQLHDQKEAFVLHAVGDDEIFFGEHGNIALITRHEAARLLSARTDVYYLYDHQERPVNSEMLSPTPIRGNIIVTTSPAFKWTNDTRKGANFHQLYLDILDEAEMREVCAALIDCPEEDTVDGHGQVKEGWKSKFLKYGGVLRGVTDPLYGRQVEVALSESSSMPLETLLGTNIVGLKDETKFFHKLLHFSTVKTNDETDFSSCITVFASDWIRDRLLMQRQLTSELKLRDFMKSNHNSFSNVIVGKLYEPFVNRVLARGGEFDALDEHGKEMKIKIKESNPLVFHKVSNLKGQQLTDVLLVPDKSNFPGIDHIYNNLLLQTTVAKQHPGPAYIFKELLSEQPLSSLAHAISSASDAAPILCFVIPRPDGLQSMPQRLTVKPPGKSEFKGADKVINHLQKKQWRLIIPFS